MSVNLLKDGKLVKVAGSVDNDIIQGAIAEAVDQAVEAAKEYTNDIAANIGAFSTKVVATLPIDNISETTIYFVPRTYVEEDLEFTTYMYIRNKWQKLGSDSFRKDEYYTKSEVVTLINSFKYTLPIATASKLGGVMVDDETILVDEDGVISVSDDYVDGRTGSITISEVQGLFD